MIESVDAPPIVGEEFVWMTAERNGWGEMTHQVADVIEPCGDGTWLVEYGMSVRVPMVIAELLRVGLSPTPRVCRCIVQRGADGRWHAAR